MCVCIRTSRFRQSNMSVCVCVCVCVCVRVCACLCVRVYPQVPYVCTYHHKVRRGDRLYESLNRMLWMCKNTMKEPQRESCTSEQSGILPLCMVTQNVSSRALKSTCGGGPVVINQVRRIPQRCYYFWSVLVSWSLRRLCPAKATREELNSVVLHVQML